MMNGSDSGDMPADLFDTVRETLIIMDDIVLIQPFEKISACPFSECKRLWKSHGDYTQPFQQVNGF
jgi:hypothetical protein